MGFNCRLFTRGTAIVCKEIVFDILEYPNQETTDPDPVIAVGTFIKELYPESIVIGLDRLENYTDPAEHPVFFVDCSRVRRQQVIAHIRFAGLMPKLQYIF